MHLTPAASTPDLLTAMNVTHAVHAAALQPAEIDRYGLLTDQRSALRAPRILLAEDNEDLRLLARVFLESEGYEVLTCADGLQAITVLQSTAEFDVLLSDVEMPGANGIEVACAAASSQPLLPVILMSGALLPAAAHAQMEAAGWAFFAKPFALPKMLTAIREKLYTADRIGLPSQV